MTRDQLKAAIDAWTKKLKAVEDDSSELEAHVTHRFLAQATHLTGETADKVEPALASSEMILAGLGALHEHLRRATQKYDEVKDAWFPSATALSDADALLTGHTVEVPDAVKTVYAGKSAMTMESLLQVLQSALTSKKAVIMACDDAFSKLPAMLDELEKQVAETRLAIAVIRPVPELDQCAELIAEWRTTLLCDPLGVMAAVLREPARLEALKQRASHPQPPMPHPHPRSTAPQPPAPTPHPRPTGPQPPPPTPHPLPKTPQPTTPPANQPPSVDSALDAVLKAGKEGSRPRPSDKPADTVLDKVKGKGSSGQPATSDTTGGDTVLDKVKGKGAKDAPKPSDKDGDADVGAVLDAAKGKRTKDASPAPARDSGDTGSVLDQARGKGRKNPAPAPTEKESTGDTGSVLDRAKGRKPAPTTATGDATEATGSVLDKAKGSQVKKDEPAKKDKDGEPDSVLDKVRGKKSSAASPSNPDDDTPSVAGLFKKK